MPSPRICHSRIRNFSRSRKSISQRKLTRTPGQSIIVPMRRLLIVDDSFTSRGMLTRIIGDTYEVSSVHNGPAAIEVIQKEYFDLVLLDLLMPEMDGFAVLQAMKAMDKMPPVLVISADIQDTTRERVLRLGAVGLINKPPKREQLLSAIDAALDSAGR